MSTHVSDSNAGPHAPRATGELRTASATRYNTSSIGSKAECIPASRMMIRRAAPTKATGPKGASPTLRGYLFWFVFQAVLALQE